MNGPLKIVLDVFPEIEEGWSTLESAEPELSSSYAILSNFCRRNALTAGELSTLVATKKYGCRTQIINMPNEDLRDSSSFDIESIARVTGRSVANIKDSFLFSRLPASKTKSAPYLRWCPICANYDYHASVFQLLLLQKCPVHGVSLLDRCERCRGRIPYCFSKEVLASPFACPHCKKILKKEEVAQRDKINWCSSTDFSPIRNVIDLAIFEDRFLPLRMALYRGKCDLGDVEAVLSKADLARTASEFVGFVSELLGMLARDFDGQDTLGLVDLTRTVKGGYAEKRPGKRPYRRKHEDRTSSQPYQADHDLVVLGSIYKSLRHHVESQVVCGHRACIESVLENLWWHMEGEVTANICPVAEAYVRWRMFWEGRGVPRALVQRPKYPYYGIVGWRAYSAPICPLSWSKHSEEWVASHIFADDCIFDLCNWLKSALSRQSGEKIHWIRSGSYPFYASCWAVAGRDSPANPLRLYTAGGQAWTHLRSLKIPAFSEEHFQQHLCMLTTIQR